MEILGENFKDEKVKLTEDGKPFLENSNIRFNISHSGALVGCAITKISDIGIDIEKTDPVQIENFRYQMTAAEWTSINKSDDPLLHFYKYWTQKEAVIKAGGTEALFLYDIPLQEHYCCSIALKQHISYSDIQIIKVNTF